MLRRVKQSAGLAIISIALPASMAAAAEVTLRMKNGDFQITGELVAYDKSKFTIMSPSLGSMTLDASRFDCVGGACPSSKVAMKAPSAATAAVSGPAQLVISGSNTVGNQLMPNLIEGYLAQKKIKATKVVGENPLDLDYKLASEDGKDFGSVSLHRHGSSTAFTELEKKTTDIGMSSRAVKGEEAQKLIAAGLGDVRLSDSEHVLGLDGLLVLVSPESPVVSIPFTSVVKIFSGQITDWSQLGHPPGKINVYAPTKESGTFDTFESLVLKPNKVELTPTAKRTANHAEQSDWVARDPLGIGFAGIAYQRNSKALNIELACGLISQPTIFNIKTEEYPLSRRLYLYTLGVPREQAARELLAFSLSPAAQPIVKQSDFIDQTPERANFGSKATRIAFALNAAPENFDASLMKAFTTDLKAAERLSVTFRFQSGSYTLDNKALADIERLVDLLNTDAYKGKSIQLAGFADTQGLFSVNTALSQNRANAVMTALKAAGLPADKIKIATKGYSELAPAACNDTPEGMNLNRRVEVWVN